MALTTLTRFTLQGLLDADGKPYKGSEVWGYPIIITKTHLIGPTFTLVKVLSNDKRQRQRHLYVREVGVRYMGEQLPFHQLTHQQQRSLDLIEEVASPDLRLIGVDLGL